MMRWLKKRCLADSKAERAADFACRFKLPSLLLVTPAASSAASRLLWMTCYREVAIMRRNAA